MHQYFFTDTIIDYFQCERRISLSSIIPHNISMKFTMRRIKSALASYSKVSSYRHKQQESNYPLRDRGSNAPLYSSQWGKKDWNIGKRYLNKLARWNANGTQSERGGEKRLREDGNDGGGKEGSIEDRKEWEKKRERERERERERTKIKVKSLRLIELEVTDRVPSAPGATNLMQLLYNSLCRLALTTNRTISEIELPPSKVFKPFAALVLALRVLDSVYASRPRDKSRCIIWWENHINQCNHHYKI